MAKFKKMTVLDSTTKKKVRDWVDRELHDFSDGPIIINTNIYSFFNCLLDNINCDDPKILGNKNTITDEHKEVVKKNIESTQKILIDNINFLLNSSIWIRFCDNGNWDGSNEKTLTQQTKDALEELEWFNALQLYSFKPAKEYIEYQLRGQSQNYLAEIGGHGVHITPTIYSNEVDFRDFFLGKEKHNKLWFKLLGKLTFTRGFKTNKVNLRLLLLDDKIGTCGIDEQRNPIHKTGGCNNCKNATDCKLRVINSLLSGDFIKDTEKRKLFKEKTYWADKVTSVITSKTKITDIWNALNNPDKLYLTRQEKAAITELEHLLPKDEEGVQIVGVRDLETALALMSYCKFDIILLDYLLGRRNYKEENERTYSTELFEFLSHSFKNDLDSAPAVVDMLKENNPQLSDIQLKEFQDNVRLNRGPLDKFWIIPMTSYNSSFISDLQSKHVKLIDHRWNISQGADPINTPWKFLYKLNEFVDLQLRQSVFWESQLLTFIRFTCEDYYERFKEWYAKDKELCFDDFQQFMGAEYANLIKRYGARKLIERDAYEIGVKQSPFAKYVNDSFFENKFFYVTTELNRLMQEFYHQAATMFDDRYGRQRLRESFERLRVFIAYNRLDKKLADKKGHDSLIDGLDFLRKVIDSEFDSNTIYINM